MTLRVGRFFPLQLILAGLALNACQSAGAQPSRFVSFEKVALEEQFPGGYGVEIADIDSDGRLDIIALATTPAQLAWYRNPGWEKQIIEVASGAHIDVAPYDINGDGRVDLALASEFSLRNSTSGGLVQWLENPGPEGQWQAYRIDEVPTSHRLKWADVNATGRKELVNLPIIGQGAAAPSYTGGAEMKIFTIPEDPKGPWAGVTILDDLEMAHGLTVHDWNADAREDLLTASFSGVDLVQLAVEGKFVARTPLVEAQPGVRPAVGASEVAVGNPPETRFLATIEPWHGHQVVVYRPDPNNVFLRQVIADDLSSAHALITVDLDNDGYAEIVAGSRSEPYNLSVFRFDPQDSQWRRRSIDDALSVSGLAAADLNADGFQDLAAVGPDGGIAIYLNSAGR